MHQTFYIDIDEEITCIVEKLKHTKASEIIMVVPRHALLIQSIVNLKILKKEADAKGLQLMIVTQDKLGKILVEKAGILVQQKVDNISVEEIETASSSRGGFSDDAYLDEDVFENKEENNRLKSIGSNEYFNEGKEAEKEREIQEERKRINVTRKTKEDDDEEDVLNKELVSEITNGLKGRQSIDISQKSQRKIVVNDSAYNDDVLESSRPLKKENSPLNLKQKQQLPRDEARTIDFSEDVESLKNQDKKIESFFFGQSEPNSAQEREEVKMKRAPKQKTKENLKNYNLSGGSHKLFWIFGVVTLFIVLGIGAYLFLPKVDLRLIVEMGEKVVDSEIIGSSSLSTLDYDKKMIPAKLVSIEEDFSRDFKSTGDKAISNQKARGTITIYNEFSTADQPLVATTRFLTEDGKLFRLIKGVTIPGMEKIDGELKTGTVQAEVMADEAGSEYNIEPATFSIPGFKDSGGDKYTKFYAKSEESMVGGGDSGEKISSVTEEDIEVAKTSLREAVNEFTKQKLEEKAGEDSIVLSEAIKKEDSVFSASNNPGDVAESFSVSTKVKAETLVVKKSDFENMLESMMTKNEEGNSAGIDWSTVSIDYGKISTDFEIGTIGIKFKASGEMNPNINLDEIKKGILGKSEDNLKAYLSNYNDIKQIELNYFPSFINSKIPFLKSRVNVTLDKQ